MSSIVSIFEKRSIAISRSEHRFFRSNRGGFRKSGRSRTKIASFLPPLDLSGNGGAGGKEEEQSHKIEKRESRCECASEMTKSGAAEPATLAEWRDPRRGGAGKGRDFGFTFIKPCIPSRSVRLRNRTLRARATGIGRRLKKERSRGVAQRQRSADNLYPLPLG